MLLPPSPLSARAPAPPSVVAVRGCGVAAMARASFPVDAVGEGGTRHHPRRQLTAQSHGGTGNRLQVLLLQLASESPGVQLAAVQELMLLARSEVFRKALVAASGDRALIKLTSRTNTCGLLRWSMAALSTLAVDDWSRRRQTGVVGRAFSLCGAVDHQDTKDGTHMVVEAACLLSNLVKAEEPATVFERLGGVRQLVVWASEERRGGEEQLFRALHAAGFVNANFSPVFGRHDGLNTASQLRPPPWAHHAADMGPGSSAHADVSDATPRGFARVKSGRAPPPPTSSSQSIEQQLAERASAVQLQSGYRGYVARGQVKAKRVQRRRETVAATRVQAHQRGRNGRRVAVNKQQQHRQHVHSTNTVANQEEADTKVPDEPSPALTPRPPAYPKPSPGDFGVRPKPNFTHRRRPFVSHATAPAQVGKFISHDPVLAIARRPLVGRVARR